MAIKGKKFKVNKNYKYRVKLTYLGEKSTEIKEECIKSLIITHLFDEHSMPEIIINMWLDKKLIDNIIKHCNEATFILAIYKFNSLESSRNEVLCFREKCTYVLPDDINKNDSIDYNDENKSQNLGDTYKDFSMGLLCIKHVNNNKIAFEANMHNIKMSDMTTAVTSKCENLIIEKLDRNTEFAQFTIPPKNSVNQSLKYLNNQKVFYSTPYRYYQDFDESYLISSNGKAHEGQDGYSNILVEIKDVITDDANDEGFTSDGSSATIPVTQINTQVYDNTIANKSKTATRNIDSFGKVVYKDLQNTSSYSSTKMINTRMNNDNTYMAENIKANEDNSSFYIYFSKAGLDLSLMMINKQIKVKNVSRYSEFDGAYLLDRRKDSFIRDDGTDFTMISLIFLKKIGYAE